MIYPIDIPLEVSQVLGFTHGDRINALTGDVIQASQGGGPICQSPARWTGYDEAEGLHV